MPLRVFDGAVNTLWTGAGNWDTPPVTGDSVSILSACLLDVDLGPAGSNIILAGIACDAGDFTLDPTIDILLRISDGNDISNVDGDTFTSVPNSDKVHIIEFAPASNGNCQLDIVGTLTLTGSAGYRRLSGTGWHSKLASNSAAAQADIILADDLDLGGGGAAVTDLEVLIEATSGTHTHYDQAFAASYTPNTITRVGTNTYLHTFVDEAHAANTYVLTRNVVIRNAGGDFGWTLTGSGTINATEVQIQDLYRGAPANVDNTWLRCTLTNHSLTGNQILFLGLSLQEFDDCLFYRMRTTVIHGALTYMTFNDCHVQGSSLFTTIQNDSPTKVAGIRFNGGVLNCRELHNGPGTVSCQNTTIRNELNLAGNSLTLFNCRLHDYGFLAYNHANNTIINCIDDIGNPAHFSASAIVVNENQIEGIHKVYDFGSVEQKVAGSTLGRSGRDCLEIDPYSTLTVKQPLWVPISKRKVEGGQSYTLTVYAAADSTYGTGADPIVLICPGGANATEQELTINIATADATKDANNGNDTWASVTSASIDVSGSADEFYPIWVYVLVPGNAGLLFLDWEWSDNDDPELEYWPLNVIGAAAAGGGGIAHLVGDGGGVVG